jgi:hypothetical protein
MTGHVDCAHRKVRMGRCDLGIARLQRCTDAKLTKIGFRRIKNILKTPAGPVLLVLALRECRSSEKTRTKNRKKPRKFSVHDVPALETKHTRAASEGQSRECPSGSKCVLYRLQLRTSYPAVAKQTDGIDAPRVASPLEQESDSRAGVAHLRSMDRTHSRTTRRGEICCAVLSRKGEGQMRWQAFAYFRVPDQSLARAAQSFAVLEAPRGNLLDLLFTAENQRSREQTTCRMRTAGRRI